MFSWKQKKKKKIFSKYLINLKSWFHHSSKSLMDFRAQFWIFFFPNGTFKLPHKGAINNVVWNKWLPVASLILPYWNFQKYFVIDFSSQPSQTKQKGTCFARFIFNSGYFHLPEFMWKLLIIVLLRISAEYLESS